MSTRGTATLYAYGRIPWQALTDALDQHPAAWADYHGFHIGTIPQEPPPYTHLWASTPSWLLRARIDGPNAIVAVLAITAVQPQLATPASGEQVNYTRWLAHTWPSDGPDAKRVGPLPPSVANRNVTLYEVDGERPVTFVDLGSP